MVPKHTLYCPTINISIDLRLTSSRVTWNRTESKAFFIQHFIFSRDLIEFCLRLIFKGMLPEVDDVLSMLPALLCGESRELTDNMLSTN
jgi:hypothetical protein